jgi:hypothetical protein
MYIFIQIYFCLVSCIESLPQMSVIPRSQISHICPLTLLPSFPQMPNDPPPESAYEAHTQTAIELVSKLEP